MKKIAVLHTIQSVISPFCDKLRSANQTGEDLAIYNTLDEFLSTNPSNRSLTQQNLNRLLLLLKAMELEEPDLIICTCTTMSPEIDGLRNLISTPIIVIDDALCEKAVHAGSKIAILASVSGLVEPTKEKLLSLAKNTGKTLDLSVYLCEEAMAALKKGDMDTHDRIIMDMAATINGHEVVILPQASMDHLSKMIELTCGMPTLSCIDPCIEYIWRNYSL